MVFYIYTENEQGDIRVLYDIECWCWKNEFSKDKVNCWRTKYIVTPIDENIIEYVHEKTKSNVFDYGKFMNGVEAINAIKKQLNPEYNKNNRETDLKIASTWHREFIKEIYDVLNMAAKDMGLKIREDQYMLSVEAKVKPVEVDIITSDGKGINDVIQEICDICHDGLEYSSIECSEIDEHEEYNTKYEEIIEVLEGKLCRILDLLGD